jgi:hypothetical protein
MARSKQAPSFLMSEGARLMVILSLGQPNPEFLIADFTRSLLSLIAVSAKPTTVIAGRPRQTSISISMGYASVPKRPKLKTLANTFTPPSIINRRKIRDFLTKIFALA